MIGFFGLNSNFYWKNVTKWLPNQKEMFLTSVPAFESIQTRAAALYKQLSIKYHHISSPAFCSSSALRNNINIIAHSMGGLDVRYMLLMINQKKWPKPPFNVVSLSTIATPHSGTQAAKIYLKYFPFLEYYMRGLVQLTCETVEELFREENQTKTECDKDTLLKFSYSAYTDFVPFYHPLYFTWKALEATEGANDGLVSVSSSSAWGNPQKIVYADHFQLLGRNIPYFRFQKDENYNENVNENENWNNSNSNINFDCGDFYKNLVCNLIKNHL